jgi:pimeloyl-ACP methyl ester carboxylesterase
MLRKAFKKLVFGIKTKLHESGKRQELLAIDHRVDLLRSGEGPPLLYLHSLAGEVRWLPFHQELSKGFDVIAPAHPGFGATEGVEETDSMEDLVFHYLDVLDGLGLERANFVGVSYGGWIAAEFAVRYPERVEKLVLADAFGLGIDEHPVPDFLEKLPDAQALRALLFADPKGFVADYVLSTKEPEQERVVEIHKAGAALAAFGRAPFMHDPKLARRLRRVTCPTLVLWGDHDPLLPLAHAERYRDLIARAELQVVRDCGHLPQLEQSDRFVEAVREFLR